MPPGDPRARNGNTKLQRIAPFTMANLTAPFVTKAAQQRHEDKLAAIAVERDKIVAQVLPKRLLARMRMRIYGIKSVAFFSFQVHVRVD
jgi:hypothetical protein